MKSKLIGLVIGFLLVFGGTSWAEEPPKLDELDALKIKVLVLERQVLEERVGRLQAEAQVQYAEKARALNAAIEEAAKNAGVELKDGWQPDIDAKVWKKAK